MKPSKMFILRLLSLNLMTRCNGGNEICKAYTGRRWVCPPPWFLWEGKCYKAIMKPLTWFQAKEECIKMGSVLVTPQSDEETCFLMQLLPSRFWINCNDIEKEGIWECPDGPDEVKYRNWLINVQESQPDNLGGNENCGEVFGNGLWNDIQCDWQRFAICKAATTQHNCIT